MKYLLIRAGDGYYEEPVSEEDKAYEENVWQTRDGESVFCLSGEKHLFEREENLSVSDGAEAVFRIPGLQSRFYIRGMQVFPDMKDEEHIYWNQRCLTAGDFLLRPGDVLFLKNLKLELWEDRIAVQGPSDRYMTILRERPPVQDPEGFLIYKRSPRLIKRPSTEKILIEFPKDKERQNKKELLTTVMPPLGMAAVTVAVGMFAGRGIYLFMSAIGMGMTAVFSGIKYAEDKKERKKKNRKRKEQYLDYLWRKQKEIARACEQEQEIYAYQYPGAARLCRMVSQYSSRIYERMPLDDDFLTIAIGHYAGGPARTVEGKEPAWDAGEDELAGFARKIRHRYSVVDKPKTIDLKRSHLGITGTKELVHRQLKILVSQLAFFHSYHDIQIIAVYDQRYEEEFAWMRWLPHLRIRPMNVLGLISSQRTGDIVLGSIYQILKERAGHIREGKKEQRYLPYYVFLIDEPSWIINHGIMEYLYMDGSALGFSIVYTSDTQSNLPEFAGTVFLLRNSEEGVLLTEAREYLEQKIRLYDSGNADFEWMARDLSMLEHEQGNTNLIPKEVTFFEMYGIRHPDELDISKRWEKNQSHRSLAVPLGMRSGDDILFLNLHEKAHGPHGLIAGTTGSGKSELIQSYILSLAVNFHPFEVGFLLIDYKGGGMANLFWELPHHMGTITNLDGGGSMRALVSVKAELSRRQRIFGEYHVNHINGYMKLFKEGSAAEPIPHLFIICDEFAELKREQPEFMQELISAARIGRSLGVHLILATQKPAGVVDEQIWSNSRFRVCLKVQNENDSKEVLRTMDAANITIPGRAYLQVGNNETYELFQSAFSKASYRDIEEGDTAADERVYVINELGQGELVNEDLSGREDDYQTGETQLTAVIRQIKRVAGEEGFTEVKRPWLPPLGDMLVSPCAAGDIRTRENRADNRLTICIGQMDIPEMQEQRDLEYCFVQEGNLLFAASAGYGKTVFLTTVLTSLAVSYDVDAVNFYIMDCGNNGCMPLKELPHTAEYITLDDEERHQKFKKLIMEEIADRKRLFAKFAAPSLKDYQELSGKTLRSIVVAVDQLDVVKEMGIEEEEFFTKLTRDGIGLGIYTVASTARMSAVRQATLNNFKNKIAGYNFDENETFLAVGRAAYRQADIKGRVFVGGEIIHEAQIYTMAECGDKGDYSKKLKTLIHEIRRRYPGREAPHIPVLPQEFSQKMLSDYTDDGSDYLIGLDVEDVTGRGFDKTAGLFVIVGNSGTGKTNILRVLADQALSRGKVYLFDSKDMELYAYRRYSSVLYVEGKKEAELLLRELTAELKARREILRERLKERPDLAPRGVIEDMPFCTVLIDDLYDLTEFMKNEQDRAAFLIREGASLGVVCIVTVHAAKTRGISELDRIVKQAANGLVLGPQGVVPIFPVASMRENPRFGDGLLFRNGVYRRVRLPKAGA